MKTFTRVILLASALSALLLLSSCDRGMRPGEYADIQLDLELYRSEYGDMERIEDAVCLLYGYETADLFDFELRLILDPALDRRVLEALIDRAPSPRNIARLAEKMLELGYPCAETDFEERAEFLDLFLLQALGGAWDGLVARATRYKELNEEGFLRTEDVYRFLDRYDADPRSILAAKLVARYGPSLEKSVQPDSRRPGLLPRLINPAQEYTRQVGFRVLSHLDGPVSAEDYVVIHVTALSSILDGTDTAQTARAGGLKAVGVTAQQLESFDRQLVAYPQLAPVLLNEIFCRIVENLDRYKHASGLTPDRYHRIVANAERLAERWSGDDPRGRLEIYDEALNAACDCLNVNRGDFDDYEKVFTEFWTYIEDYIGPPRLGPEAYSRAVGDALKVILKDGGDLDELLEAELDKAGYDSSYRRDFEHRLSMDEQLHERLGQLLVRTVEPVLARLSAELLLHSTDRESDYELENLQAVAVAVKDLSSDYPVLEDLLDKMYEDFEEALRSYQASLAEESEAAEEDNGESEEE